MQSIFSAELCLATIYAVLLASHIITHVHLYKRWVEREKERSLNSTLIVCIVEIYNDQHNTPSIPFWFLKLHVLISFNNGCFRRLCGSGGGGKGKGCRLHLAAFTFEQLLQILKLSSSL